MEKVTIKALNSANVRIDNSADSERVYDITANVNVSGTNVTEINGEVRSKNDTSVISTFNDSSYELSVSYRSLASEEQLSVNGAINAFMSYVKDKVSSGEAFNINVNN